MSETPAPYFVSQRFEVFSSADRGWVAAVVWLDGEWEVLVRSEAAFATKDDAIQALAAAFPHWPGAETVASFDHDPYDPLPAGAHPPDPEPSDPVHWLDWRTQRGGPFSPSRGVVIREPVPPMPDPVSHPSPVTFPRRPFAEWERSVRRQLAVEGTPDAELSGV